jgi:5-(carboxyamino)imidazole ribonucleotide mutase
MKERNPKVVVIMGSDSDLPTMSETMKILDRLSIEYSARISSAHRAPHMTARLAEGLEEAGFEVAIVGAGLAAHLPGVIASFTMLPVIGVPMEGGSLRGLDALYSIVQMPAGVPVATVSIGKHGAKNAAILAAQILALKDTDVRERLRAMRDEQTRSVEEKDRALTAAKA